MQGIAAFFARESVPDFSQIIEPMINSYLDFNIKQPFEMYIVKPSKTIYHGEFGYTEIGDQPFEKAPFWYKDNMKIGDLLILSKGASIKFDKESNFILANNSSNIRTIRKAQASIDYLYDLYLKNQRDMKRTLEECDQCDINLIACDINKMNLMSANDGHCGMQMCHAYIKGIGFMLHQNMVCLRNIIHDFTDCSQDAVNLWETWYGHPLEDCVIRETDLESGSMRKIKFNPKWSY